MLKYLYYGGLAYCGVRDFVNARRWFECVRLAREFVRSLSVVVQCMSVPAAATSAIVVAAYKTWVITSIIVDGKVCDGEAINIPCTKL
jgi:hypothetical protein